MEINSPSVKEEKEKYFLAIDIGTELVKTLFFKKDKKISILGISFQPFQKYSVFDSIAFEKDVIKKAILKSIEEVFQNLSKKIIKDRKNLPILLGLPVNILKGRIIPQSFKRESPKIEIQEKEEAEIYQQIFKEAKNNLSQNFSKLSGILPEDLEFLTLEILEIKIDGYEVPYLRGFKGKNLDFRIMIIFGLRFHFEEFKSIFKEIGFQVSEIIYPAQNLRLALSEDFFNGIFLDISSNFSQIFLIKEGKLVQINEFEIGGKNFSQSLSQILGITEREADLLREKYYQRTLSEGVRKRIKEIIEPTLSDWFRNLKFKLKEAKEIPLPSNIFLFGEGCQLPDFQEILEVGDWENLLFLSQPKVKLIYPKDLKNIEDLTKTLNTPKVIPSLLICYHYGK